MLGEFDILFRLFAATLIGLLIGFTRRHKPAGIRTFALICLGSAIFTIISVSDFQGSDPTRVIAQIVAGVGFLGLGVIWKHGVGEPTGLTTAAGIWVAAALGVLIGLGWWFIAFVGTALTLLIFYSKKPLQKMRLEV